MPNALLYTVATLIWGSTWLVITFQYGVVPASASAAYRFLLAGALILGWCVIRGHRVKLTLDEFRWSSLQGSLMFGVSYMLVYEAERHIASGLMAVLNSSMVLFNLIGMRFFSGKAISKKSWVGVAFGITGIVLVFWPELSTVEGASSWLGVSCGVIAAVTASAGNIVAQRNRDQDVPMLPSIGYGMLVGGAIALLYTRLSGQPFVLDVSPTYLGSLLYLTIFGSIIAFAAYLTLMGRIGASRSGYIAVAVPIVALVLSAMFEKFHWQLWTVAGIGCAIVGNVIMLADIEKLLRYVGLRKLAAHLA